MSVLKDRRELQEPRLRLQGLLDQPDYRGVLAPRVQPDCKVFRETLAQLDQQEPKEMLGISDQRGQPAIRETLALRDLQGLPEVRGMSDQLDLPVYRALQDQLDPLD